MTSCADLTARPPGARLSCGRPGGNSTASASRRKDRDAIPTKRPDPNLGTDFDGDGAGPECGARRFTDDLAHGQRLGIDLHDVRSLRTGRSALACGQDRAIRGPPDVIDTKSQRNLVPLGWRLPACQSKERLTAPGSHVKTSPIRGDLEPHRPRRLCARNLVPSCRGVPFPELAVLVARHHFLARCGIDAACEE